MVLTGPVLAIGTAPAPATAVWLFPAEWVKTALALALMSAREVTETSIKSGGRRYLPKPANTEQVIACGEQVCAEYRSPVTNERRPGREP